MITTYKQLLEKTLEEYESATVLSRTNGKCTYEAIEEGAVGCAIGCHLDPEYAIALDSIADTGGTAIKYIYLDPRAKQIIHMFFDVKSIGLNNLSDLQHMHDSASSVGIFRMWLQLALSDLT